MVQRRLQGGEKGVRLYKSTIHCAYHTVRGEGPAALYKGFLPSFARMGPWNVIFFLVYERLKLWNFGGSSIFQSIEGALGNLKEFLGGFEKVLHVRGDSG